MATVKDEFTRKNLGLNYHRPDIFYSMECSCIPTWLIYCVRIIFTCYSVATLLYSIIFYNTVNWPVFLTNWNLVTNTIYFVWLTTISGLYGLNQPQSVTSQQNEEHELRNGGDSEIQQFNERMPLHLKLFWVWFNITYIGCIVTVAMYWGFVLDVDQHLSSKYVFSYVNDHAVNLVLLLIDFCFHVIPFRVLHAFHTIIFALMYITVNIIFQFASGGPVYSVMDWETETGWSIFYVILAIILCFLAQFGMYGLHRLKLHLKRK